MSGTNVLRGAYWTMACLAALYAGLAVYTFVGYRNYFHSDSAAGILLAEEILRSGQWLPQGWNFVGDQIWILTSAQLAVPVVALLGATLLSHAVASALSSLLLVMAVYFLARSSGLAARSSLVVASLPLAAGSLLHADLLFGQMVSFEIAKLAAFVASLNLVLQGRARWLGLMAVLVLVEAAASPNKSLVYYFLPAMATLVLHRRESSADGKTVRFALVVVVVSTAIGIAVHGALSARLLVDVEYGRFVLAQGVSGISENMQRIARLAGMFLGVVSLEPEPRSFGRLLADAVRISGVSLLAILLLRGLRDALGGLRSPGASLAVYATVSGGAIVGALALGAPLRQYYGVYYLLYPATIAMVAAWHVANTTLTPAHRRNALFAVVCPFLLLSSTTLIASRAPPGAGYLGPSIHLLTHNEDKQRLAAWLLDHDIRRGFTPFWDANALTVLSGGHLDVVPVRATDNHVMKWLVSESRIARVKASHPIFVAVPVVSNASLPIACIGNAPVSVVSGYRVVVHAKLPADCLP